MKAWGSKAMVKVIKAFKVGDEYHQEVQVSCRDTFLQGFELCKAWDTELFPDADVEKLKVEFSSGSNEGFDGEDSREDGDPASLR